MKLYVVLKDTKCYLGLGNDSTAYIRNTFIDITDTVESAIKIIQNDIPFGARTRCERHNCSHVYEMEVVSSPHAEILYYVVEENLQLPMEYENGDLKQRIKKLEREVETLKNSQPVTKSKGFVEEKVEHKKEEKSHVKLW